MLSRNLLALALAVAAAPAFAGDEAALGRKLMIENGCNGDCHKTRAPDGDPTRIFTRANPKVTSMEGLKRQVGRCVAAAGRHLTDAEVAAIVAALNTDYYKFK